MRIFTKKLYICLLLFLAKAESWKSDHDVNKVTYCEYYNETMSTVTQQDVIPVEKCGRTESGKRNHCYALWNRNSTTGETIVKLKGCFLDNIDCYNKSQCVDDSVQERLYFCCCDENMCNENYSSNLRQPAVSADNDFIPDNDSLQMNDQSHKYSSIDKLQSISYSMGTKDSFLDNRRPSYNVFINIVNIMRPTSKEISNLESVNTINNRFWSKYFPLNRNVPNLR